MFRIIYDSDIETTLSDESETVYVQGNNDTVQGGLGADWIAAILPMIEGSREDLSTSLFGGGGNDTLHAALALDDESGAVKAEIDGGSGNDEIVSSVKGSEYGDSVNDVWGGSGDDAISLLAEDARFANNTTYGDNGSDTIRLEASAIIGAYNFAEGGAGNDHLTAVGTAGGGVGGGSGGNDLHGGDGDDVISAHLNLLRSESGERALSGANSVYGDAGNDRLSARIDTPDAGFDNFYSFLYGGAGDDRLSVQGGYTNWIYGNQGNDTLIGGDSNDQLIGGQGADYLRGYGESDTFVFMGARGLSEAERDRIVDFTIGEDVIDVHSIDAKSWRSGNQTFTFDAEGTGKSGTVWVEENPDTHGSIVYANNGKAMLAINLLDGRGVHADDYGAADFIL